MTHERALDLEVPVLGGGKGREVSGLTIAPPPPAIREWRIGMLILDPSPSLRAAFYEAWETRGASVVIETELRYALIHAVRRKFSFFLVPASGAAAKERSTLITPESVIDWAEKHAPSYVGRVVGYGTKAELSTVKDERVMKLEVPTLTRDPAVIQASLIAVDGLIEHIRQNRPGKRPGR